MKSRKSSEKPKGPKDKGAKQPAQPRAAPDFALLEALRAWTADRTGGEAAQRAARARTPGEVRFQTKLALDRLFRRHAHLTWRLTQGGLEARPDMLWALNEMVHGKHAPDAVARMIAVTTKDATRLSGRLARASTLILPEDGMPEWVRLECPEAVIKPLRAAFGPRLAQELNALNLPAPLDLRVNTLKTTPADSLKILRDGGIEADPGMIGPLALKVSGRPDIAKTKAFTDGLIEPQDEASQAAALLAQARPGEQVLDLCAGAGGKSLALAAAMQNKGHLVAADTNATRLQRAKLRMKRAGVENAERVLLTGMDDDPFLRRKAGQFDCVFIDAPCSGTGAWRRNPEAKWGRPFDLERLTALQDQLLDRAVILAKPKGRIVFVTCSLLPEEGQVRIDRFLKRHKAYVLKPAEPIWSAATPLPWPCDSGDVLTLTPGRHGTDGFFAAVLVRG